MSIQDKMKLGDLIPSSDAGAGIRGIEKQLQSRRYTSRWGLIVAVVSVVVQVALHLSWPPLPKDFSSKEVIPYVTSPTFVLLCVAVVAAVVWVLAGYTGFLFKQSKEPFRYTFCIKDFSPVASTTGERFSVAQLDQLKLLRYDLTERLDMRVRRFSLLEDPKSGGAAPSPTGINPTSHFHIAGDYAIREENDGWILHVWPRVRIGPESNPFTLAFPVRLPFEVDGETLREIKAFKQTKPILTFNVEEYGRLVERVYSSVATEIYKQIEIDLRDKMKMFPTGSLRALARYNEAEDFETSNTIEAYDRALEMYQSSLDELKASRRHAWRTRVGCTWLWPVSWEWTGIRAAMEAEAKTALGYSRCLIYRRLVSEMAGRDRNSVFDAPRKLERARELFRQCYNSAMPTKLRLPPFRNADDDSTATTDDSASKIALASNAASGTLRRKRLCQLVREELGEALAVSALAHSVFADSKNAQSFLQLAEAGGRNSDSNRALLLLVEAELEPRLQQKVTYLTQAKERNPHSEIVLFRLAYYSDLLARDRDEITPARAENLSREYEAVLKVNPLIFRP